MRVASVQSILGILLMAYSLGMLPPLAVSVWYADGEIPYFLATMALMLGGGAALWLIYLGLTVLILMTPAFWRI